MESDCGQRIIVVGLCVWSIQGDGMSGEQVFEQLVAFADITGKVCDPISEEDYEQWKRDYIWEALHGIRYGQSFCNHFGITDNHLWYSTASIEWADRYIRKHYLVK